VSAIQDGNEAADLDSMKRLLDFLDHHPTLLEPAERWVKFQVETAVHRRVAHEEHLCLRCGSMATMAIMSRHREESIWRWLDLCETCGWLMHKIASESS
jgi:hypothetical protein